MKDAQEPSGDAQSSFDFGGDENVSGGSYFAILQ
jgi:hypothetical protein